MFLKIKLITQRDVIVGMEAMKFPEGTILRCIEGGNKDSNVGDILERTSSDVKPFRALVAGPNKKNSPFTYGQLWGNSLESYKFVHLQGRTRYDYPVPNL